MARLDQLREAVENLLAQQGIAPVLQLNSNTRERAFEAFVFSLVLQAVRQAGGTVYLRGIQSGDNPTTVVFRGAPGQMGSRAQDFTYASCILNNRRFEVHVDIQYFGSSGATHEIDVSIYDEERADAVRESGSIPSIRNLHGALECKFYDSSLGTGLGRAFVGLVDDCGTLVIRGFVTNGRSDDLARYFRLGRRPEPFFDLSPLRPAVVSRFVSHTEQALRKWAGVA